MNRRQASNAFELDPNYVRAVERMAMTLGTLPKTALPRFLMGPPQFWIAVALDEVPKIALNGPAEVVLAKFCTWVPLPSLMMLKCALELAEIPYEEVAFDDFRKRILPPGQLSALAPGGKA